MAREGVIVHIGVYVDSVALGDLREGESLVAAYNSGYARIDAFAYPYVHVIAKSWVQRLARNDRRTPQYHFRQLATSLTVNSYCSKSAPLSSVILQVHRT